MDSSGVDLTPTHASPLPLLRCRRSASFYTCTDSPGIKKVHNDTPHRAKSGALAPIAASPISANLASTPVQQSKRHSSTHKLHSTGGQTLGDSPGSLRCETGVKVGKP